MKHRKNTAFFVEALLLTLFVLALSAVLVQLFAAARSRSTEARALTQAQQIAQNVSETFYASDSEAQFWQLMEINTPPADGQSYRLNVDEQGLAALGGAYQLDLTVATETAGAGQMARLTLVLQDSAGHSLFEGSFDHYLPQS